MQDTAFEWFLKNIPERFKNAFHTACQEEIQKTRELEKGQITKAYCDALDLHPSIDAVDYKEEEYYSQKYKQNG